MAVQMERLAMGQPVGDGTEMPSGGKLSPEDAERWIESTMRALERSRRRQRDLDDAEASSPLPAPQLPATTDAEPGGGIVRIGRPADDVN
jgi:hypothetical protein